MFHALVTCDKNWKPVKRSKTQKTMMSRRPAASSLKISSSNTPVFGNHTSLWEDQTSALRKLPLFGNHTSALYILYTAFMLPRLPLLYILYILCIFVDEFTLFTCCPDIQLRTSLRIHFEEWCKSKYKSKCKSDGETNVRCYANHESKCTHHGEVEFEVKWS